MRKRRLLFISAAWLLIFGACEFTNDLLGSSDNEARTYYETLDLETPESAVITFSDAFARDDFLTVYLVLSQKAQFQMMQRLNLMQYGYFFQTEHREEVFEDVTLFADGLGEGEHVDMGWYIFDQIMLAAKENNALLIDLSGEVTIIDSEDSESEWADDPLDVITEVDGIDGEVIFRMVQSPSDRWRVLQVIVEDGDELMVPWAVPNEEE
ncbi:MAG: hypothetical protein FVQ83_06665 [Chloroflexi bacterium]|nr:hypothetical protein [Chloroflexota bacterium]